MEIMQKPLLLSKNNQLQNIPQKLFMYDRLLVNINIIDI
jgi:hypothetical protein